MSPRWGSTPRLTGWLTVSRNVTLTLTLTAQSSRQGPSREVLGRSQTRESSRQETVLRVSAKQLVLGDSFEVWRFYLKCGIVIKPINKLNGVLSGITRHNILNDGCVHLRNSQASYMVSLTISCNMWMRRDLKFYHIKVKMHENQSQF
jgi:hypothetical protein